MSDQMTPERLEEWGRDNTCNAPDDEFVRQAAAAWREEKKELDRQFAIRVGDLQAQMKAADRVIEQTLSERDEARARVRELERRLQAVIEKPRGKAEGMWTAGYNAGLEAAALAAKETT